MIRVAYLHEHGVLSGGEQSLLALWEGLDRARFEAIVMAPPAGPLLERARALGLSTHAIETPRFRALVTPGGIVQMERLVRRARNLGVDIFHGNTPHTNLAAAWAGRRLRRRVVWHARALTWGREYDVERAFAWLPDRIICNSAAVARRFGGESDTIVVVRNGVRLDRFRPGAGGEAVRRELRLGPEEVAVGIVGNFSAWKRHEVLFEALAGLRAHGSARGFVVGGEVFEANRGREAALRATAAELGIGERVAFVGIRDDMPAVMDALDIVVSTAEAEACSRAIVEAMAAGTPVIAAAAGGNPELVADGETGVLFPAGNAAALTAALDRLVGDAGLRRKLGDAARARAEAWFSVERQVSETEAVYDSLVPPAPPARDRRRVSHEREPSGGEPRAGVCVLCGGSAWATLETEGDTRVVRCRCGLVFVTPPPPRQTLEDAYDETYYEAWETQARRRRRIWERRLRTVERLAPSRGTLLDVGCGIPVFLRLARACGWGVVGTELSPHAAATACAEGIRVVQGEVWEADLPSASFDVVTAWHVIEHQVDPRRTLEEMHRLLRPGGLLVLATPNVDDRIFRAAYRLARRRRVRLHESGEREVHLFHFSSRTLARLVAGAGFDVLEVGFDRGAAAVPAKQALELVAWALHRVTRIHWGLGLEVIARKR